MGLFVLEDVVKVGEPISREENTRRRGHYRLQVHKNLYLDAEDSDHFEGRYINDTKGSDFSANVRFTANYRTNI